MGAQDRIFLVGAGAGLVATVIVLSLLLPAREYSVKKPDLPVWAEEYVSAYNGISVAHIVLAHGFFGVRQRLSDADILFMGSSHVELGLSAEELSSLLAQEGKTRRAYNIGVGWGEGFTFAKNLINLHDLRCKTAIIDLYDVNSPLSIAARNALTLNSFSAYAKIVDAWLAFITDWIFDSDLPRITNEDGVIKINRRLNQVVPYRRWRDGDLTEYWSPEYGNVYRDTPTELITHPNPAVMPSGLNSIALRHLFDLEALADHGINMAAIFIPETNDSGADDIRIASSIGMKVIRFSYEGIELFDGYHTNERGRSEVTRQLARQWNNIESGPALDGCAPVNSITNNH
jgi:hypothetical protein